MCKQTQILDKIHKEGKMNGFAIELAEAQAMDYITMNKRVIKIEKDVSGIKKALRVVLENQARQGGQIDLIVKRMNSPVDEERKDGIIWKELKSIAKTPMGKLIILLVIGAFALAGNNILQLIGIIK